MADRKWTLRFSSTLAYLAAQKTWHAWMGLAGRLLFTSLLGAFLLIATGRTARIERLRALTQAAGAAAHEINQPLTVIQGLAQLKVYSLSEDHPDRPDFERIDSESRRISGILKKMRTMRQYATRTYIDGIEILDIHAGSENDPAPDGEHERWKSQP